MGVYNEGKIQSDNNDEKEKLKTEKSDIDKSILGNRTAINEIKDASLFFGIKREISAAKAATMSLNQPLFEINRAVRFENDAHYLKRKEIIDAYYTEKMFDKGELVSGELKDNVEKKIELETDKTELEKEIKTKQDEIKFKQDEIKTKQDEIEELGTENNQEQVEKLETEKTELQKEITELETKIVELKEKIKNPERKAKEKELIENFTKSYGELLFYFSEEKLKDGIDELELIKVLGETEITIAEMKYYIVEREKNDLKIEKNQWMKK